MTRQDVFNRVVEHFNTMSHPSMGAGKAPFSYGKKQVCAYRGDGGSMCFLGIFIPDDCYEDFYEGMAFSGASEIRKVVFATTGLKQTLENNVFFNGLQAIHDQWAARGDDGELRFTKADIEFALREYAGRYELTYPEFVDPIDAEVSSLCAEIQAQEVEPCLVTA